MSLFHGTLHWFISEFSTSSFENNNGSITVDLKLIFWKRVILKNNKFLKFLFWKGVMLTDALC